MAAIATVWAPYRQMHVPQVSKSALDGEKWYWIISIIFALFYFTKKKSKMFDYYKIPITTYLVLGLLSVATPNDENVAKLQMLHHHQVRPFAVAGPKMNDFQSRKLLYYFFSTITYNESTSFWIGYTQHFRNLINV